MLPFWVSAGACLVNAAFGWFVLPESLPPERRRKFEWARANPFGAFKSLAHLPMIVGLLVAVFLYQIAHDSLPAVWMFYTQHKFHWSPAQMGMSLTFVGITSVMKPNGVPALAKKTSRPPNSETPAWSRCCSTARSRAFRRVLPGRGISTAPRTATAAACIR